MRKVLSFLIALFVLTVSLTNVKATTSQQATSGVSLVSSTVESVEMEFWFGSKDLLIDIVQVEGNSFSKINLADWQLTGIAGEPKIPFITALVAVPIGAEVALDILPGSSTTRNLDAPILPTATQLINNAQFSADWPTIDNQDFAWVIKADPNVYNSSAPYPREIAEITNDGIFRDQRILSIVFYPIQYDPKSQIIEIYDSANVRVKISSATKVPSGQIPISTNPFKGFLESQLLNIDSAEQWRASNNQIQTLYSDQIKESTGMTAIPWSPPLTAWKIALQAPGMYSLSYENLFDAGVLDNLPDPRNIRLFHLGQEIAIEVLGQDDGSFDLNDKILFYAPKFSSKYAKFDIFWLAISNTPGKRIVDKNVTVVSPAIVNTSRETRYFEQNLFYITSLEGGDDFERFLWTSVRPTSDPQSWIQDFSVSHPLSEAPSTLTIKLLGYFQNQSFQPDHHVKIFVNATEIRDYLWDGMDLQTLSMDVTGLLVDGSNTLEIRCMNDLGIGYDWVMVDWFSVDYPRSLVSSNNYLQFQHSEPGDWAFEVEIPGTAPANPANLLRTLNVTETANIERLLVDDIQQQGSSYKVRFLDHVDNTNQYVVFETQVAQTVDSIQLENDVNLLIQGENPEMIIISPAAFLAQAEILASFRTLQGTKTVAVNVQDVYDYFSFGVISVDAIRAFLGYALDNWQTSYVLLFGDGHYDPKDYLGFGRENYIPAYLAFVDPWWGETAADNRYVTLIGDDELPDMVIGRLTPKSSQEATDVVQKIINYEQTSGGYDWAQQILSVADNVDNGGNFPLIAEELFASLKLENYALEKVHYLVTHGTSEEAQQAIVDGINAGKVLVNYIGHGSYTLWSDEPLFSRDDISKLTNVDKLPIVLSMTCLDGFFHNPNSDFENSEALAEAMTLAQNVGAIASWSPTGLGLVTGHDYLNRGFLEAFFNLGASTVGEATLAGKLKLWASGANQDLLDTYTLFGDPALKNTRLVNAISDNYEVLEDTTLSVSETNGVICNDIRPNGLPLAAVLMSTTSHGVLNLASNGSFVYTPDPDFFGTDNFEYTLFDGSSHSNNAMVTISVMAVNDPPVALDQEVLTFKNNPVAITLEATDDGGSGPYFLLRETEAGGAISADGLVFSIVTQPLHGELTGAPPNLSYTPFADYVGTDQFTFKVNDGEFDSNTAMVKIHILETMISPIARDDTYEMFVDSTLLISSPGVLGNDTSQNEQPLSAVKVTDPVHGSVTLTSDGGFSFQAESGFTGSVSFEYKAIAGTLQSNQAEVNIIVKPHPKIFMPIIFR